MSLALPELVTLGDIAKSLRVSRSYLWTLRKNDPKFPIMAIPYRWFAHEVKEYILTLRAGGR